MAIITLSSIYSFRKAAQLVPYASFHPQFEALIQFFLGRSRVDMSYDDSLLSVVAHNLSSPGAFWSPSTQCHSPFFAGQIEAGR